MIRAYSIRRPSRTPVSTLDTLAGCMSLASRRSLAARGRRRRGLFVPGGWLGQVIAWASRPASVVFDAPVIEAIPVAVPPAVAAIDSADPCAVLATVR